MPQIRELAGLKNGRYGYCQDGAGKAHGASQEDVIAYVAEHSQMPAGAFERFMEGKFSIPDCQVRVHCFSKNPLRLAFSVSDIGTPIEDNWWETGKD